MKASWTINASNITKGDTLTVKGIVYTIKRKMKARKMAEDIRNFYRPYLVDVHWHAVPGGLMIEIAI